jgi:hypothetical protein
MAIMASASSCKDNPSQCCRSGHTGKGRIVQGTHHQRDAYQKDASFDGRNVSELLFRDTSVGVIAEHRH